MPLNDINQMFSIVDPNTGKPTDYLMRLLRDRGAEVTDLDQLVKILDNDVNVLDGIVQQINGTQINAGTGLDGGGVIGTNDPITINLENTSVTPGSYTNTNLTVDAQGRITAASNGTGGGGGGGAFGEFAFDPPDLTDLPTQVFLGTSGSAQFVASKGLILRNTANGGTARGIARLQAAPALPFTVTARVMVSADALADGDRSMGVILRNSSNGRQVVAASGRLASPFLLFQNWSSVGAFNSTIATVSTSVSWAANRSAYVAIHVNAAGLMTAYYSIDGATWYSFGTSANISAYLTAAGGSLDQIGVWCFGTATPTREVSGLCTFYRVDNVNPPAIA